MKKVVCDFEGGGTVGARVWLRTEHDVVWRERERERERETRRERGGGERERTVFVSERQ